MLLAHPAWVRTAITERGWKPESPLRGAQKACSVSALGVAASEQSSLCLSDLEGRASGGERNLLTDDAASRSASAASWLVDAVEGPASTLSDRSAKATAVQAATTSVTGDADGS